MATHATTRFTPIRLTALSVALLTTQACTEDPVYIEPPESLTSNPEADPLALPTTQLTLPLRLEETDEEDERAGRAEDLGLDVPYVAMEELTLSMEWSLENLDDSPAQARIHVNGANEYFAYVPLNFVVDPEEEPPPPPLIGDIPLTIPAGGTITGVFREDQFREAAIDLELITRGGINPYAAMLEYHEDVKEIAVEGMPVVPRSAFASLVRLDIGLQANRQVRLRYIVRARSARFPNYVHDEGLQAAEDELTVFEPVDFVPVFPEEELAQ